MNHRYKMEGERLYSIGEAAKICGISRATLLRLEEAGFDKPIKINPESGRRYYDVLNIMKIQRYLALKRLGVSQKDILNYYKGNLDKEAFLEDIRERLDIAQRCVDEFESCFTERESITYTFYELPEVTCYCFVCPIKNIKEQVEYNYKEIQNMYDMGFKPASTTPMFCVIPNLDDVYDGIDRKPYSSVICMSIRPDAIPDEEKVVHFKSRRAFSLLYHGDRDYIMENGGRMLLEEMKKHNLTPAGPLFGINVVGVFFGNEIEPDDYVFRFAIPVE